MTRVTELDLVYPAPIAIIELAQSVAVGRHPERDRVRNVYPQQHAMSKALRAVTIRNGRINVGIGAGARSNRWRPSSLLWLPEAVVGYDRYPYMKFGGRS